MFNFIPNVYFLSCRKLSVFNTYETLVKYKSISSRIRRSILICILMINAKKLDLNSIQVLFFGVVNQIKCKPVMKYERCYIYAKDCGVNQPFQECIFKKNIFTCKDVILREKSTPTSYYVINDVLVYFIDKVVSLPLIICVELSIFIVR